MITGTIAVGAPEALPWRRSLAWLLVLGPFFFASYGFSNWWTATWATPGVVVFAWETWIPFVAWTIVPYWSIDLLYGLSFLLCRTRREVDTHAFRLLTAQLICVACFLAFPLRFSFDRPPTEGLYGTLFDILGGFDRPFNQAPSLHIALLVIVWIRFAMASRGLARVAVDVWASLIGISVLTTYQHHFIDVPTGALVGFLCLWAWPDDGKSPLVVWRRTRSAQSRRLGGRYLLAAAACVGAAMAGGWALWLLWPALALGLVGAIYLGIGSAGFQKRAGRFAVATSVLLAPYRVGAWLNSRWWTRAHPEPDRIVDDVWLGRQPTGDDMRRQGFTGLCDLTAELPSPRGDWAAAEFTWLDLVVPDEEALRDAAASIDAMRQRGPVLVCCALGYSRSACAVAAWLLCTGRCATVDAAVALLKRQRPGIVLGGEHRAVLARLAENRNGALGAAR